MASTLLRASFILSSSPAVTVPPLVAGGELMTPAQLNQVVTPGLDARVRAMLNLDDFTSRSAPALSGFITFQVLSGISATLGRLGGLKQLKGWPKQVALAKVAADVTGDTNTRADADHIGNNISSWLADRKKRRGKAQNRAVESRGARTREGPGRVCA